MQAAFRQAIPAVNIPASRASAWTNPADRLDVLGNGRVNGHDLALIAQALRVGGERVLNADCDPLPGEGGWFWDVNGDGALTQADYHENNVAHREEPSVGLAASLVELWVDEDGLSESRRGKHADHLNELSGVLDDDGVDDFFA